MTAALETLRHTGPHSELLALLQREFDDRSDGQASSEPARLQQALRRVLLEPARHVLARPGKELRAQLLRIAYRLAGGAGEPPAVLPHIIEVLHAGSLVIDDVEDDSHERRGAPTLHRVVGSALAINTGNWLYFWPLELLAELALPSALELEVHRQFARTMCSAHRGQALDLGVRVGELVQSDVARGSLRHLGAQDRRAARLRRASRGALRRRRRARSVESLARFGGRARARAADARRPAAASSSPRMRDKGDEDLRLERVTCAWALLAERLDACTLQAARAPAARRQEPQRARRRCASELESHLREHDAAAEPRSGARARGLSARERAHASGDALAQLAQTISTSWRSAMSRDRYAARRRHRQRFWRARRGHSPAGRRHRHRDLRGARQAGRARLRLPRAGLHVRRRPHRDHGA